MPSKQKSNNNSINKTLENKENSYTHIKSEFSTLSTNYQMEDTKNNDISNMVKEMSYVDRDRALKKIGYRKAKDNYTDYLKLVFPTYIWTPFHVFISKICQSVVEKIENGEDVYVCLSVPPQHGKLLENNTPVLTTKGWKKHGDLKVGDELFNHKGEIVKVLNVFPKNYANCKVTFSNGEEILCHENHEWLVYDRFYHNEIVRETKFIEKCAEENNVVGRGHRYRFQLPNKDFIKGEEKELFVNPYAMGVWLGDGKANDSSICASKEDRITIDECRKYYPKGSEWKHKTTGVIYAFLNGLSKDLRKYGLCNYKERVEKFIPQEYLTSSVNQRLELLAGLIDTDGYVDLKQNRIVFTTADEKLKNTFEELIATFGWRTTTNTCKPCVSSSGIVGKKEYWQIAFNPTITIPCRISRKVMTTFSKQRKVSITKIERIEPKEGNCIQVEGGIYLCGKKMIPTHNSETITKTLPSWFVGRNPDKTAILVSYNDDFASLFGDANRNKTEEFGRDVFGIEISDSMNSKMQYEIKNHRGGVISRGFMGGITGNGGSLIIIDDPYKNSVEANNPTIRNQKLQIYKDSIRTRCRGKGKGIIVIQTRWHEEDLIGVLSKQSGWYYINIPCVCDTERDIHLHRKLGETLCPQLGFDAKWAEETKAEVGLKVWEALYQGHPSIDGGEIFTRNMIKQYSKSQLPNDFEEITMSCDLSFGGKDKSNDPCAIQVWGRVGANHYLLKRIKKRLTFNEMCDTIKIVSATFPTCRRKIVEKKANGQAIIDSLNNVVGGFEAYDPKMTDKIGRANSVTPYLESGNVWFPDNTIDNTIDEMIEELMKFPNGAHDDEVDAMTQYLVTYQYKVGGRVDTNNKFVDFVNAIRGL